MQTIQQLIASYLSLHNIQVQWYSENKIQIEIKVKD